MSLGRGGLTDFWFGWRFCDRNSVIIDGTTFLKLLDLMTLLLLLLLALEMERKEF
jgi:hypothetical protein